MNNEKKKEIPSEPFIWLVPQCCREGWASCPHVVNRKKVPKKKNVGL